MRRFSLRSEEHTSELQSRQYLVCRLLLEKKNIELPNNQGNMNMSKQLQGKVALDTDSSNGNGAQIALELAEEGAVVAVNYSSSKQGADDVVAKIKAKGGKAVAVHGNLSDPKAAVSVVADTVKAFGPIDVLVNNAGIYEFAPLD